MEREIERKRGKRERRRDGERGEREREYTFVKEIFIILCLNCYGKICQATKTA